MTLTCKCGPGRLVHNGRVELGRNGRVGLGRNGRVGSVGTSHGLQIFESPDLPDCWVDLLSDGDTVYSRKNRFGILGTPVKLCLICTGTAVKICWKYSRNYFKSVVDVRVRIGRLGLVACELGRGMMVLISTNMRVGFYLSGARRRLSPRRGVAVCCSVSHCVAVCCSVLQCVAVCCSV